MLDDRICPGCRTPTLADRPERLGVLAGLCTACERLWLPAADLAKLVGHVPATRAPLIPPFGVSAAPCPSCQALAVEPAECDGGELLHCTACGGVLLTRGVLDALRGSRRQGAVAGLAAATSRTSLPAATVDEGVSRGQPKVLPSTEEIRAVLRGEAVDGGPQDRPDRVPFDHPWLDLGTYPLAALFAWLISGSEGAMTFMLPAQIFIHELGHAIPSWLSSRRALPLPCGVTFWEEEQSLFVGFGMVFLLGVLIVHAFRERRPFGIALGAGALVLLAFFSLAISNDRSFEWTILGGVAGEFWVSTLLIVSFFFRMPDRLRWDFFRMVLIFPAFTTWVAATRLWFGIAVGSERMPTGSIFGGSHDEGGDLNRLMNEYGWAADELTRFYTGLAVLTGVLILAVYVAVGSRRWSRWARRRT